MESFYSIVMFILLDNMHKFVARRIEFVAYFQPLILFTELILFFLFVSCESIRLFQSVCSNHQFQELSCVESKGFRFGWWLQWILFWWWKNNYLLRKWWSPAFYSVRETGWSSQVPFHIGKESVQLLHHKFCLCLWNLWRGCSDIPARFIDWYLNSFRDLFHPINNQQQIIFLNSLWMEI